MTGEMYRVRKGHTTFGFEGDVYRCSVCGFQETVVNMDLLMHKPGQVDCLQNQINDLSATVSSIIDKLGGDL